MAKQNPDQDKALETKSQAGALAIPDYGSYEGMGLEDAPIAPIPFIKLIMGREEAWADPSNAMYNKPAGSWFATEDGQAYSPLICNPVHMIVLFNEWQDSNPGNIPPIQSYAMRPGNARWIDGDGQKIKTGLYLPGMHPCVETHYWFVAYENKQAKTKGGIITMSKTALEASRNWLAELRQPVIHPNSGREIHPPVWARQWELKSEPKSKEGFAWYVPTMMARSTLIAPAHPTFKRCVELNANARAFAEQMNVTKFAQAAASADSGKDDMPF